MRVKLSDDLTVIVMWQHFNPATDDCKVKFPVRFGTNCRILKNEDGKLLKELQEISIGMAFLHEKDHKSFNKAKGRKLSLERALYTFNHSNINRKGNHFTKEDRTKIWDAFRNPEKHTLVYEKIEAIVAKNGDSKDQK